LFEKKINAQTRQPMAVLRKLSDGKTPMFQIIGAKEPEYRALRKVFEQVWFRRIGGKEQDDELNRFMYNSIEPISEEIAQ
jgi:hypothetical protein